MNKAETLGCKLPSKLAKIVNKFLKLKMLTRSEFIRSAIKEKIERESPELFQEKQKPRKLKEERGKKLNLQTLKQSILSKNNNLAFYSEVS